ncbi:hypothetical protein [Paraburkholderia megapolitana]|uniref:hypothetical protein n=1 Tax=Paraburkholderia megapolitana TaxID=420953 RepID=UPI0038BB945D
MQLREIHALHARFARETLTIDVSGQRVSPAALAAPEHYTSSGPFVRAWRNRNRVAKYVGLTLAGCVICCAIGVSAADLLHVLYPRPIAATPRVERATPVPAGAPQGSTQPTGTPDVQPLSAASLDGAATRAAGLKNVSPSDLAGSAGASGAAPEPRAVTEPVDDAQRVMASPVRVTRPREQPTSDSPARASQAQAAKADVAAGSAPPTSTQVLRRPARRRSPATTDTPPAERETPAAAQPQTQQRAAHPADVQLF